MDPSGKGAVVTGGGSGIGRAIALALARAGADVVVADIEKGPAQAVADEVAALGGRSFAVQTDVSQRASVEELAERAFDALGGVHILCNNAGVFSLAPLDQARHQDWEWVLSVNLWGVIHGVEAFVPRIRDQGQGGHVVNTASLAGFVCGAGIGIYNTTKFAVVGLSETLAQDVAPHRIGVSVLCPGVVSTRIFDSTRNRPADLGGHDPAAPEAAATLAQLGLDAAVCGDEVVRAIRDNRLWVFTHPEAHSWVSGRFERVLAEYDAFVARSRTA